MAEETGQNRDFLLGSFEEKDGALYYRYEAELVLIQPWGENSLRIRASKKSVMPDQDWALIPQSSKIGAIEIGNYSAAITHGKIKAVVNQIGKISIYNQKNELQ